MNLSEKWRKVLDQNKPYVNHKIIIKTKFYTYITSSRACRRTHTYTHNFSNDMKSSRRKMFMKMTTDNNIEKVRQILGKTFNVTRKYSHLRTSLYEFYAYGLTIIIMEV